MQNMLHNFHKLCAPWRLPRCMFTMIFIPVIFGSGSQFLAWTLLVQFPKLLKSRDTWGRMDKEIHCFDKEASGPPKDHWISVAHVAWMQRLCISYIHEITISSWLGLLVCFLPGAQSGRLRIHLVDYVAQVSDQSASSRVLFSELQFGTCCGYCPWKCASICAYWRTLTALISSPAMEASTRHTARSLLIRIDL